MKYSDKLSILTDNLRKSEKVNHLDMPGLRESDTLAYALLDIEDSCKVLLTKLLPKLTESNIAKEIVDEVLFEIGEEFRHILYHLKDPKFYEYLAD